MSMKLDKALKTIESERIYSLTEIVKSGLIPHIKSYPTAYRAVLEDQIKPEAQRTLNATIIGEGRARTIRIKGANLIAYLKATAK